MFARRTHTPASFWSWFQARQRKLLRIEGDRFVALLGEQLGKVAEGLVCEVGPVDERPREFILSADGIRSLVDTVDALADAAPPMPEWQITRFRPPLERFTDFRLEYGPVTANAADVRFTATPAGPRMDLTLYAAWRTEADGDRPDGPAFIMLDMALGEYDVMCRVGVIDLLPLAAAPPDARPWAEVREAVRTHAEA